MDRRTFLKLSGITSAVAALAGCKSANEKLIPYLIPPDEGITPGIANYYASTCRSCPVGCGVLVRWAKLPSNLLERISTRIVNEVKGVNRVVLDITSKPPGTIEWE